jgi:multicomponent K+:H+ antiporter subunit E
MKRLFPHPAFSLLLALIWLLLVHSMSLGHILLALSLGWAIPFFSEALWPRRPPLKRPWLIVRYTLVLLWDILVANISVAALILGPSRRLQPAFVVYPIQLHDRQAITILANTISLTPGTVTADVSLARQALLIHALHVEDEDELIRTIYNRYEKPLQEIFG